MMTNIMITGAGGSIGSLIVSVLYSNPNVHIIALDSDESRLSVLYEKYPELQIILIDLRSPAGLGGYLHKVDKVIHTAAYKQVPFLQNQLLSALYNNVIVTEKLLRLCVANGVKYFLHISTDKAVEPISVLGVTKHLSEQIVFLETKIKTGILRLVNVLDSSSSVFVKWKEQYEQDRKILVTSLEMKRFFIEQKELQKLIALLVNEMVGGLIIPTVIIERTVEELTEEFKGRLGNRKILQIEKIGPRSGDKYCEKLLWDYEKVESEREIFKTVSFNIQFSKTEINNLLDDVMNLNEAAVVSWIKTHF